MDEISTIRAAFRHGPEADAAMLARHANNHRVTITGNVTKEKDKDVLKATNLQMLAVCQ